MKYSMDIPGDESKMNGDEGKMTKEMNGGDPNTLKQTHSYGHIKEDSLWCRFKLPFLGELRFNPVVSFISMFAIWAFVLLCIYVPPEDLPFGDIVVWIVDKFTWLYIGSQDVWAVFIIYLYFSKYSRIKLGKDDEKPEYNDATWFMMLFACGVGIGLFFYGVAEPLYHYTTANRYTMDRTMPDNTVAQIAINIALYHWGIHGWIVYCLIGLLLGLLSYREELPMTVKSCFYPLIGNKIYGWMGDLVDVITVLTTLFGICTSLGLGTKQISNGINVIWGYDDIQTIEAQIGIIWVITAIATISTVTGIGAGIRMLSEICFILGMFLMTAAFLLGNPFYLLNLLVQSIGYYVLYLIQIGFHCDAFEMSGPNGGQEDRHRFVPPGDSDFATAEQLEKWMDSWTMFYWGWWIAWSPFVGMFIAKISRGRTIREFINGTLTAPVFYSILWMVIFGGTGLVMERHSAAEGYCCIAKDGGNRFLGLDDFKKVINERGIADEPISAAASAFLCGGSEGCGSCSGSYLKAMEARNKTYGKLSADYDLLKEDFVISSPDRRYSRLSCRKSERMWFDVMRSYGLGDTYSIISLVGIILYFVTSSDSGSLVIDSLTSNGDPEPPRIQRVFWALMEGATATALVYAGRNDPSNSGISAVLDIALIAGLPYTVLFCALCVAILRYLQMVLNENSYEGRFKMDLFDPFYTDPWGTNSFSKVGRLLSKSLMEIILVPLTAGKIAVMVTSYKKEIIQQIFCGILYALAILFFVLEAVFTGSWVFGLWFYICFCSYLAIVRFKVRDANNIEGNIIEDFCCSFLLFPCVSLQMKLTVLTKDDNQTMNMDGRYRNGQENISFES